MALDLGCAAVTGFKRLRVRRDHHVVAALILLLIFLAFIVVPGWASVFGEQPSAAVATGAQTMREVNLALPPRPRLPAETVAPIADWHEVKVQSGDSLGKIFAALGLPAALMYQVLEASPKAAELKRLRAGQRLAFRIDGGAVLRAIRFDPTLTQRVTIELADGDIKTDVLERPLQRRVTLGAGTVTSSLFAAADDAGMSDATIVQLAKVLAYDIDFARDIQRGDHFSVVYQENFQDGERFGGGEILAATFINKGKRFTAVRHVGADGKIEHFSADGRPLRKAFLRTPLEFSRISSRFSMGRLHPILGRMRAHRGVDYAAPTGTPIMASGDGLVTFRGWQSGYGNTVIIDHGSSKTTLYGHLSRFGKGLRKGQRVRQGEKIGYVGMTGLATGPHLHYEFRLNGSHRDPLTVVLPPAEPLRGAQLAAFKTAAEPLLAKLDLIDENQTLLAKR